MAIDRNRITAEDVRQSMLNTSYCFPIAKSDTDYLTEPDDASKPAVSGAISLSIDSEPVAVELWDGKEVIIPAGTLQAGVRYQLHVVKLLDTGTGATVQVLAWKGLTVSQMRAINY